MNNMFAFEQTPWELACARLSGGENFSAMRFLTLLEGEEEDAVEDALQTLEEMDICLDISDLPRDYASGDLEKRLRLEERLVSSGQLLTDLPQEDPLSLYLNEMAAIPVCGDIQLLAMDASRADCGDDVRAQLANLCLSRVVELAGEYTGRGVLLLDLIQEGSLGLWNGILGYDGRAPFDSVRDRSIRRYMAKAVTLQARSGGVGQKVQKSLENYRQADRALLAELGRNPALEEIAQRMGVSPEEAAIYEEMLNTARTAAKAKEPQGGPQPEDEQAVEDTAYFQSRQRIDEMLSTLEDTQAQVLKLRFGLEGGQPMTAEQTGLRLGLTPREVTALEAAALGKLRDLKN